MGKHTAESVICSIMAIVAVTIGVVMKMMTIELQIIIVAMMGLILVMVMAATSKNLAGIS